MTAYVYTERNVLWPSLDIRLSNKSLDCFLFRFFFCGDILSLERLDESSAITIIDITIGNTSVST